MRRNTRMPEGVEMLGGGPLPAPSPPEVRIDVCTCGCVARDDGRASHPEWPLAQAWSWLTRPAGPGDGLFAEAPGSTGTGSTGTGAAAEAASDEEPLDEADPASYPWWDARSGAARRRAVLPLVLLGEVQAGVLLRAVWEVAQNGSAPLA